MFHLLQAVFIPTGAAMEVTVMALHQCKQNPQPAKAQALMDGENNRLDWLLIGRSRGFENPVGFGGSWRADDTMEVAKHQV